jgi:hypothetical protein
MRNLVEGQLQRIVNELRSRGEKELAEAIDDPRQCRSWLKDYCGSSKNKHKSDEMSDIDRHISALVAAARLKVPGTILKLQLQELDLRLPQLMETLRNDAIEHKIAEWAVIAWASALGKPIPPISTLHHPSNNSKTGARTISSSQIWIAIGVISSVAILIYFISGGLSQEKPKNSPSEPPIPYIEKNPISRQLVLPPDSSKDTMFDPLQKPKKQPENPEITKQSPNSGRDQSNNMGRDLDHMSVPKSITPTDKLKDLLKKKRTGDAITLLDNEYGFRQQVKSLERKKIKEGLSRTDAACYARTDFLFYILRPEMEDKSISKMCSSAKQWDYMMEWCDILKQLENCRTCKKSDCKRPVE